MPTHLLFFWDTVLGGEWRIWKILQADLLHENMTTEFSENVYSIAPGREPFLAPTAYGRPVVGTLGRWKKCDSLTATYRLCQLEAGAAGMGSGGAAEQEPSSLSMPAFWSSALD